MAASMLDPSWTYGIPMEPIPEEDDYDGIGSTANVSRDSQSSVHGMLVPVMNDELNTEKRKIEQKQRTREIYTSEQVDTLVSTVPKDSIPECWSQFVEEQVVVDPEMTATYITENLAGPPSARGSTYSYTYESHADDPIVNPIEECIAKFTEVGDDNVERHSTQTQKVTRVTKITTTRSVRQVPVNPSNIFFDADGNPVVNGFEVQNVQNLEDGLGIDLSKTCISEHEVLNDVSSSVNDVTLNCALYYTPSAPGVPQVIDIDSQEISLAWLRPESNGCSPIVGYRVEFRQGYDEPWEAAHDDLLLQTECRIEMRLYEKECRTVEVIDEIGKLRERIIFEKDITKQLVTSLHPQSEYQFRVLGANAAGFGQPSTCTSPIRLRPHFNANEIDCTMLQPTAIISDTDRCTVEWQPLSYDKVAVVGYIVEYRTPGSATWVASNDYPVSETRYDVTNLRPNGEYEFRIKARFEDGTFSDPSRSTGFIKMKPTVPIRSQHRYNPNLIPPGPPQVLESDSTWVQLHWMPSPSANQCTVSYVVEMREIGDPIWYTATTTPITTNELIIEHLHTDSTYEFRAAAVASDGSQSNPSETSDIIRLRPLTRLNVKNRSVPDKPIAPEYLYYNGGNSLTLCWVPAQSSLPVEGYEVEFRDFQQNPTQWLKVTDKPVYSCKTTVGYLLNDHEYQFRVIAKNAVGYSEPSDASTSIIVGKSLYAPNLKDIKYVEAERYGTISLLQDEIVRESPPLPDRDDSPPPIYRQPNSSNLQWRDPTLKEVIDYLKSQDLEVQRNASGYLQHLTFNDNFVKEETRNLGGIPLLVRLLDSDMPEIQRNACGCLKNLAYGKSNDENKKVIMECNGVRSLSNVIKSSSDSYVKEEATGALWNISSADDLKEPVLNQTADTIINQILVPMARISDTIQGYDYDEKSFSTNVFRNGTGILRNISAANNQARHVLRRAPYLIECLLQYLKQCIIKNHVDTRAVENVVCILRNLSYRVEEVVNPKYNPKEHYTRSQSKKERSKSAPSDKKKTSIFKKGKKSKGIYDTDIEPTTGPLLLWHPDTIKMYLQLLQESSNPETLEASAAALQNLAACQFEGSVQTRSVVRQEKGLSILTELLKVQDDKVMTAVATALRNLVLDQANCELIGKNSMQPLIEKLPKPEEEQRDPKVNDATLIAILGIMFEIVKSNTHMTRSLHELGGTIRLRKLAISYPAYGPKVCKYATQVLYMMWQHKELHDGFKRSGLKESNFYSGHSSRTRDTTTLARPISSQGAERPIRFRSENMDDSADSDRAENSPHRFHTANDRLPR